MREHIIKISGSAVEEPGLSGHLLRDLTEVFVTGAEQALRYRLEGKSTARGPQPVWLRRAADFQITSLDLHSPRRELGLQARSLVESMAEQFGQAELFDDLDPRRSPLDLFEDALADALDGKADSDAFDHPLLQTCAAFETILSAGIDSIEIMNGRTVRIDPTSMLRVVSLTKNTFAERRVSLAGRIDLIRYSDCRFTLITKDGAKVAGTAKDLGTEALRDAFGKDVVITGRAEFRPSGRLLRIEAESVDSASEKDLQIFSAVPRSLSAAAPIQRAPTKGGLAALLGKWPGDEPLEPLLAQLGDLS